MSNGIWFEYEKKEPVCSEAFFYKQNIHEDYQQKKIMKKVRWFHFNEGHAI